MRRVKNMMLSIGILVFWGGHATAATTLVETFTFDATLTSGTLLCGEFVGLEEPCPGKFGVPQGAFGDDLMFGKTIGDTYAGVIKIGFDPTEITSASCSIGGANCLFSDDFLQGSFPLGDDPTLDFSSLSVVLSLFDFSGDTGSYFFATDYSFDEDGVYYYTDVRFDLTNVSREVANVPLSGSVGFLALALGAIGFAARRRRS